MLRSHDTCDAGSTGPSFSILELSVQISFQAENGAGEAGAKHEELGAGPLVQDIFFILCCFGIRTASLTCSP